MARTLINVDVPDLDRGVAFYRDAFGLTTGRRLGPDGFEMLGAGVPLYLLAKPEGSAPIPGASGVRRYARHWTPVHLDWVVDDIDVALVRAEHAGATRESGVTDHPWGRMVLLADPFGNGCCLLEFNGRGYDAIAAPT